MRRRARSWGDELWLAPWVLLLVTAICGIGCAASGEPDDPRTQSERPQHVLGSAEDASVGMGPDGHAGDLDAGVDSAQRAEPTAPVLGRRILLLATAAVGGDHAFTRNAQKVLSVHRLEHELWSLDDPPAYERDAHGLYSAIVITDYDGYEALPVAERRRLDDYCRRYGVGVYFLHVRGGRSLHGDQIDVSVSGSLHDARIDAHSPVVGLVRDGGVLSGPLPGQGRLLRVQAGAGYFPVALATRGEAPGANIVADDGSYDGIRRIFHAHDFSGFWLHDLLFVDGLVWLSPNDLGVLRERYVNVDIDDVFMPNWNDDPALRTVKIQRADVEAMLATQRYLSTMMEGTFRFSLGFNSGYYETDFGGESYEDVDGDHALVEHRAEFHWFDHLPRHQRVVFETKDELVALMQASKAWAEAQGVIDHVTRYAVTPYHSGIGDKYEPLFEAWREVWDLRYTSATSATPGFTLLGIRAAPRLNFAIWSEEYEFGRVTRERIDRDAAGGAYFAQIIEHPVAIFMTHEANFARDRIVLYLLERLISFLHRWTSLRLIATTPDEAVEQYFERVAPRE